jgi:helicase MOV-10
VSRVLSLNLTTLFQKERRIVGLQRNHRSHGTIIAWSNRYLYEDVLRECGNAYITYHLVHSTVLPKKGFPVVFHGVDGSEQHSKRSPPYPNIPEALIVRNYCVKLTEDPDPERNICECTTSLVPPPISAYLGIDPEEIGVITPYKSQVRAIRKLLKFAKLSEISVGTVEEFQGRVRC